MGYHAHVDSGSSSRCLSTSAKTKLLTGEGPQQNKINWDTKEKIEDGLTSAVLCQALKTIFALKRVSALEIQSKAQDPRNLPGTDSSYPFECWQKWAVTDHQSAMKKWQESEHSIPSNVLIHLHEELFIALMIQHNQIIGFFLLLFAGNSCAKDWLRTCAEGCLCAFKLLWQVSETHQNSVISWCFKSTQ